MRPNLILFVVSVLLMASAACLGQEATVATDSTADSSYSALDSAYTAVVEQKPQINLSLVVIKLFWIFVTVIISVLFWRYLLQPVIKMTFNQSKYQDDILTALKFIISICVLYLVVIEILAPTRNLQIIIIAAVALGFALAGREYLRDIISGIGLLLNRNIRCGDKIKINGISGELVEIGIKSSVLKSQNGSAYIIPNFELTQNIIPKKTPEELIEQVDVYFYLPNDIDMIKAKEITHRAASLSRFVYLNKPINLKLTNEYKSGRSILKLHLTAYVLNAEYSDQFISDTTENVMTELMNNDLISSESNDLNTFLSD